MRRQKQWGIPWGWVFSVLNVRDSPKVTSLDNFDGHLWRWSLILSFLFGVSWIRPSFGSLLHGFLWLFVMWNMLLSLWWLFSGLHMEGVEYHLKSERLSATPPCDHRFAQIVNDSRWHHHKMEFQWISEAGTPYLISLLWLFVMDCVFWSILVLLVFQPACWILQWFSTLKAVKVEVYIVGVFFCCTFLFLERYTPLPLGGGWFYQPLGMIRKTIYDASAEKTVPLILAFILKIST